MTKELEKEAVRAFWNERACGEIYATGSSLSERLAEQERVRYLFEPYIFDFAKFSEGRNSDVLEVGVGMGVDHLQWAKARPHRLVGVDLTERAVQFTRDRLEMNGFKADVWLGDAEHLDFPDSTFDIVYSWGVLHHSPDTAHAIREICRVLRPHGTARIMIYHTHSLTGWMLWLRYALLRGRLMSMSRIYSEYLESPGTKAFTKAEARAMCEGFRYVQVSTRLGTGDLLLGAAGQRHQGSLLKFARPLWPRWLIKMLLSGCGLGLLIEARK